MESIAEILFVAVNYCSDGEAINYLASLRDVHGVSDSDRVGVLLVDNSPANCRGTLARSARRVFPGAQVLGTPENLGYFGGARYGLHQWLERRGRWPDCVILSNVDVRFLDRCFLERLMTSYAMRSATCGVIAPSIIATPGGTDANPFLKERIAKSKLLFCRLLFECYPAATLYKLASVVWNVIRPGGKSAGKVPVTTPAEIYAPHGAMMVFLAEYFARGGTLQHVAFLFGEELFVAETCRRVGLRVIYDPTLRVLHRAHVSTSGIWGTRGRAMIGYQREALRAVWEEFFVERTAPSRHPKRQRF